MIKTQCIFDLNEIAEFYSANGQKVTPSNDQMFFALKEDGKIWGLVKIFPCGSTCVLEKAVTTSENKDYEEFLLKSAINLALTFNCETITCDVCYGKWLVPMHFKEQNGEFVGKVNEIDFPNKCGH